MNSYAPSFSIKCDKYHQQIVSNKMKSMKNKIYPKLNSVKFS